MLRLLFLEIVRTGCIYQIAGHIVTGDLRVVTDSRTVCYMYGTKIWVSFSGGLQEVS